MSLPTTTRRARPPSTTSLPSNLSLPRRAKSFRFPADFRSTRRAPPTLPKENPGSGWALGWAPRRGSTCVLGDATPPPQLKACWHCPEKWLQKNLRPAVVVQRALALSRRHRTRLAQERGRGRVPQTNPPRPATDPSSLCLLEGFAGTAPLSRCWTNRTFEQDAQALDWCRDEHKTDREGIPLEKVPRVSSK